MGERIRPTRSGLFAIELLIAVGIFTMCAAICVGLFVKAEVMSRRSADLTRAVSEARNAAECWKAAGGDIEAAAGLVGAESAGNALRVWYDGSWQRTGEENAVFTLSVTEVGHETAREAEVHLSEGDETLVHWNIAALEVTP